MLANGFGEHNIQGIGDKHIPLIHNVLNTDLAVAISDEATDASACCSAPTPAAPTSSRRRSVPAEVVAGLDALGLSSICNVLGAVKTAKLLRARARRRDRDGRHRRRGDVRERARARARRRTSRAASTRSSAGEVFGQHMLGAGTDDLLELTRPERERIFNLGYYTWVEQQGDPARRLRGAARARAFWTGIRTVVAEWDAMIDEFNARAGVLESV